MFFFYGVNTLIVKVRATSNFALMTLKKTLEEEKRKQDMLGPELRPRAEQELYGGSYP